MRGYFTTAGNFLAGRETDAEIVALLRKNYPGSESGMVSSWKELIAKLRDCPALAELPADCALVLEYELPTLGMGVDLMVCGYSAGGRKIALLVEAKRWNDEYIASHRYSEYRGESGHELHPQVQVAKHRCSFQDYLSVGEGYWCLAKVYLPHASEAGIGSLTSRNPQAESREIPCVNRMSDILKEAAVYMASGGPELIKELQNAHYEPSRSVIDAVDRIVHGRMAYNLTAKQEVKFQEILDAVLGGKRIIRISGPAGSGKTALLLNLYLKIYRGGTAWGKKAKLITGAQNTYLYRELYRDVRQVFEFSYSALKDRNLDGGYVVLVDEAQHNEPGLLTSILNRGCTLVLCYDGQQTLSPSNALEELEQFERRPDFVKIELEEGVRYNNSPFFERRVREYLAGKKVETADNLYDFRIADSFEGFRREVQRTMSDHPGAEVAVIGLLSSDAKDICSRPDSIFYNSWGAKEEARWLRYVRDGVYDPEHIWVGTWWMPGLDVDYVAVLAGGDVTWTSRGLTMNIRKAKHYRLLIAAAHSLALPVDYDCPNYKVAENIRAYLFQPEHKAELADFQEMCDRYIGNLYYVMMTRGRKGAVVYFENKAEKN